MKIFRITIITLCIMSTVKLNAQTKKVQPHIKPKVPNTSIAVEKKFISVEEFLKLHTEVKNISWGTGYVATLEKTDGSKEVYHLDNRSDEKKFVSSYGQILRQSNPIIKQGE